MLKKAIMSPVCHSMIVPCNQLVRVVIVDAATNNYEAFTLPTLSLEYNIILHITPTIFSNLHKMEGK
jgi:hypothetical protein